MDQLEKIGQKLARDCGVRRALARSRRMAPNGSSLDESLVRDRALWIRKSDSSLTVSKEKAKIPENRIRIEAVGGGVNSDRAKKILLKRAEKDCRPFDIAIASCAAALGGEAMRGCRRRIALAWVRRVIAFSGATNLPSQLKELAHRCRYEAMQPVPRVPHLATRLFGRPPNCHAYSASRREWLNQVSMIGRAMPSPPPMGETTIAALREHKRVYTLPKDGDVLPMNEGLKEELYKFVRSFSKKIGMTIANPLVAASGSESACFSQNRSLGGLNSVVSRARPVVHRISVDAEDLGELPLTDVQGNIIGKWDEDELQEWIDEKVRDINMFHASARSINHRVALGQFPRCSAVVIPSSGWKARIVTKHKADELLVSSFIKAQIFPALKNYLPLRDVLAGDVDSALIRVAKKAHKTGQLIYSADLTAATDWLSEEAVQIVVRAISDHLDLTDEIRTAFAAVAGPHLVDWKLLDKIDKIVEPYPDVSQRGIFMGLHTTWTILNVLHAFVLNKAGVKESDCAICGDDAIFTGDEGAISRYEESWTILGGKINRKKTFQSPQGGVFCERLLTIDRHNRIGISRAFSLHAFVDKIDNNGEMAPRWSVVGPIATDFALRGADPERVARCANVLCPYASDIMRRAGVEPALPRQLGGGSMFWERYNPLSRHSKAASRLVYRTAVESLDARQLSRPYIQGECSDAATYAFEFADAQLNPALAPIELSKRHEQHADVKLAIAPSFPRESEYETLTDARARIAVSFKRRFNCDSAAFLTEGQSHLTTDIGAATLFLVLSDLSDGMDIEEESYIESGPSPHSFTLGNRRINVRIDSSVEKITLLQYAGDVLIPRSAFDDIARKTRNFVVDEIVNWYSFEGWTRINISSEFISDFVVPSPIENSNEILFSILRTCEKKIASLMNVKNANADVAKRYLGSRMKTLCDELLEGFNINSLPTINSWSAALSALKQKEKSIIHLPHGYITPLGEQEKPVTLRDWFPVGLISKEEDVRKFVVADFFFLGSSEFNRKFVRVAGIPASVTIHGRDARRFAHKMHTKRLMATKRASLSEIVSKKLLWDYKKGQWSNIRRSVLLRKAIPAKSQEESNFRKTTGEKEFTRSPGSGASRV